MRHQASPQHQAHGVIAVLQALVAQLMEMLRAAGARRELVQRLVSYETQLVLALFGGGLAGDPEFIAATAGERRLWRRNYARDLASLRALRLRLHSASTLRGHGYRRKPVTICVIRFERRIAQRRSRRFGCLKLAFVAATREPLSGAPP